MLAPISGKSTDRPCITVVLNTDDPEEARRLQRLRGGWHSRYFQVREFGPYREVRLYPRAALELMKSS